LNEYYATVLAEHKIEMRYYNPAALVEISSVQFRNHRKLLVRDGVEAITGGRNIADEYFDLSKTFNFLDRDVWVEGELVKAMRDGFELYWASDIVQTPAMVKMPTRRVTKRGEFVYGPEDEEAHKAQMKTYNRKMTEARALVELTREDERNLEFALSYGAQALQTTKKYDCPEASFATDREGASLIQRIFSKNYNQNYRLLRKEIAEWLGKIDDEVIFDSPYFLENSRSRKIMQQLLDGGVKITILTNSINSTDALYVATVFDDTVKLYTPYDAFNAYIYKGTFSNEADLVSNEVRNAVWGTHSKTILFNDNSFMIGTFNIDNRSNFYNTEMAIFCSGSPELANDVYRNIKVRMKNSYHLGADGKPDDGTKLLDGASMKKKLLFYMLKIPATIFQFLM